MKNGSKNYQVRLAEGWIVGNAKYATVEPHHGPEGSYVPMHDPARERLLCLIIDSYYVEQSSSELEKYSPTKHGELTATIWMQEIFPRTSDDWETDWHSADMTGLIRRYLVKGTRHLELIHLEEDGYWVTGGEGIDEVREGIDENDDPIWIAEYYRAELIRNRYTHQEKRH